MKKKLFIIVTLALVACFSLGAISIDEQASGAVVKYGSNGDTVRTIQTKLKRWGYYTGAIDGIFGSGTRSAVRYFQSRNGLTVDGIVGAKTAKAMGITLTGTTSSNQGGYSASDVYLLAKLIYGEARGEPYQGQVAVGAVVLNRVKSAKFPNTISGVIYQPYAFTAVDDGQINLTPNETAKSAARDALNGWDPTNGCLYYYNPRTATSKWIWSRPIVTTIGRHNFCM